jgi:hypothetical protein
MGLRGISPRGAGLAFVLLACLFPATASAMVRPLADSNYSAEAVCGQPLPGRASCLAYGLVPETQAARSHSRPIGLALAEAPAHGEAAEGAYGLRPADLHNVYNLPLDAPGTQTIGIVDAFNDPTIEADLRVYDEEFGLPECTHANGCFTKLNQAGATSPLPATSAEWAVEITLDVESAHSVCQNCKIVLVEANSNSWSDLETAEGAAVAAGANEVSNSYGSVSGFESSAYNHPGVVITASTGDDGFDNWEKSALGTAGNYPASSPYVVAVGGTELSPFTTSWTGESAWSNAGSGCSTIAGKAPAWQTSLPNWAAVGCGNRRAVADISADADPFSGIAIYDSTPFSVYFPGWATFGGTSLSSPIVAAEFALAGGAHGVAYPAQTVYENRGTSGLHDIVAGSNLPEEECDGDAICSAGSGYDGPTGVGSPNGLAALEPAGSQPTVTGVSPASGPSAGGELVNVTGTNLKDASAVHFGDREGTIEGRSETLLKVETPRSPAGLVNVVVTGPTGNESPIAPGDLYEYTEQTPHITSISPVEGTTAGGTTVTLEGTGLGEIGMVEFGAGYFAAPDVVEKDRLTVTTPAHPLGQVQVVAHGPFVDANTILYTYVTPPPPRMDTLTVDVTGSGAGSVAISPFGGPCQTSCSARFEDGTAVTLTAQPQSGATFAGWSGGGCSGTGPCHLVLGGDTGVTATFQGSGSTGTPFQTITVPMVNPNGVISNSPQGPPQEPPAGDAGELAGCLAKAQKAYRHAVHQAHSARGNRAAAVRKAKRLEAKQDTACRKRF